MKTILDVRNLFKRFGPPGKGFVAVNDISFRVKEGEIVGFLGPNGAGKTTTISMLLGVLTPTSGSISYFGLPFPEKRREILAMINYSSAYTKPPWRLTVHEHLYVNALLYEIPDPEKRINRMLEIFHVGKFRNTLCSELSAGNTARVNLCRAFINYPKLILLDEPTSSLDPEVVALVHEYILKVQDDYKTSVLLTSHNMSEIEVLCDRVIFINHGKIVTEGEPEDLIRKTIPTTRVRLYMRDGQKRTLEYCRKNGISVITKDRYVEMDVKEEEVSRLLNALAKKGVDYSEITINKPTLEDYFIGETRHEA